jgi:transposase
MGLSFQNTTWIVISVPKSDSGRLKTKPKKPMADKAYDSHPHLKKGGISLLAPYTKNRANHRLQYGQIKTQYKRSWIVERTISRIRRFKLLVVKYENKINMYLASFHLVCAMIILRQCQEF